MKVLVIVQEGMGGVLMEMDSAVGRAPSNSPCRVLSEEVTHKLKAAR